MTPIGPERQPQANVPIAKLTTLGVGGAARWFAWATRREDVVDYVAWSRERQLALVILGGGSNVVVADQGLDALVLQMDLRGASVAPDGEAVLITAGAGEVWDDIVAMSVSLGLGGLACLSGIPGRVGGTPIQNVGAYGQDVADVLETVLAFDRSAGRMVTLPVADCRFSYRSSRFKEADAGRFVICAVTFRLTRGRVEPAYPELREEVARATAETAVTPLELRNAVLAVRRRKGMVLDRDDADTRSVGSFFMNPVLAASDRDRLAGIAGAMPPGFATEDGLVKIPAAWLIEHAGFARGTRDGAARISTKHTLALVNDGGATARDVIRLATRIKQGVQERYGVVLRPEPVFLGFDGDPDVTYLQRADL